MPRKMPVINECEMTECAYNQERGCHAMAITVGDEGCPMCDTYFRQPQKGGVADMKGGVGACHTYDCKFNDAFECSAPGVKVARHQGHADCSTFAPR